MPTIKIVPMPGSFGPGTSADIADFVFDTINEEGTESRMTVANHDMIIRTTRTSDQDADISLNSADDIWLNAGDEIEIDANRTILLRANDGIFLNEPFEPNNQIATIGDINSVNTGDITFDGIQIIGAGTAAGDGSNNGTIELVPDGDLNSDQYIIIDPTGPNHIHIRAGGTQDASNSELILGGERNKVAVSDLNKSVAITTAATITNTYVNANEANSADLIVPETSDILIGDNIVIAGIGHPVTYFSPDPNNTGFSIVRATGVTFVAGDLYTFVREEPYENYWSFNSNGVFSGPAMGGVKVPAIANTGPDDDLYIYVNGVNADLRLLADQNIRLNTDYGDIILNADGGEYIGNADSPENQIATIGDIPSIPQTGSWTPILFGTGVVQSSNPATGSYTKIGSLVFAHMSVPFTDITNFGTGQYFVTLPFDSARHSDVFGGSLHDTSIGRYYSLKGHLEENADAMSLWYISGTGLDDVFDYNSPVTLETSDLFHMSFVYEATS